MCSGSGITQGERLQPSDCHQGRPAGVSRRRRPTPVALKAVGYVIVGLAVIAPAAASLV
jgi:hypothetical protein